MMSNDCKTVEFAHLLDRYGIAQRTIELLAANK